MFAHCFPEKHVAASATMDHYLWKFRGLRDAAPAYEFAAHDAERRLVGYYAALPYFYRIHGRRVVCGMVCDVMTHSAARGQGVFTGLGRYSLGQLRRAGVGFVSGYPIRPDVLPGHLKIGWRVAFHLPLYVKVLRTDAALRARRLGWLAPAANVAVGSYLSLLRMTQGRVVPELRAQTLDRDDFLKTGAYDSFFSGWAAGRANVLGKDRRFLAWRLGAPSARYRVVVVWQGEALVGVAITRPTEFDGMPCLALLDLMLARGQEGAAVALHREIEAEARRTGTHIVAGMMSAVTASRTRALRAGFVRSPFVFKLILNRLDDTLPLDHLTREADWDLMWIDSDDM